MNFLIIVDISFLCILHAYNNILITYFFFSLSGPILARTSKTTLKVLLPILMMNSYVFS